METIIISFIIPIIGSQFKSKSLSIESSEELSNRFNGAFMMTRSLLSITNASHRDAVCETRRKSVEAISFTL